MMLLISSQHRLAAEIPSGWHALGSDLDINLPERACRTPKRLGARGVCTGIGSMNSSPPRPSARVGDVNGRS